jgi:hypothetical protein
MRKEMNPKLKQVSEIIAQANDSFYERNSTIDTLMGIMDKALRKQGMPADAITIDCLALDKKMVFLLHDAKPNTVNITLGNKAGDIDSSSEHQLSQLTVDAVLILLEDNFLS